MKAIYGLFIVLTLLAISCHIFAWPFPGKGVLDPPPFYQRYREALYPRSKPYFQWWYYWIKDLKEDKHYAFTYAMTRCADKEKCDHSGTFNMIAFVDNVANTRLQKYERYPLSSLQVDNNFHVQVNGGSAKQQDPTFSNFEINPIGRDSVQITGHMKPQANEHVWQFENCAKNTEISWNLTMTRIYGYYAQDLYEKVDEDIVGLIMWNTYMHDAAVVGTITIGGTEYNIQNSTRFRAYGDMNWGTIFPSPPPSDPHNKNFNWGWYMASMASEDTTKDISMIAGTGLTSSIVGVTEGKFADIRLNSTFHIEAKQMVIWADTVLKQTFKYTNDGELLQFRVDRTNWTAISDKFGDAEIPMRQTLTIETSNYVVIMDFVSEKKNYNRLLFPFNNSVFSDFEGLGVPAFVSITHKPTKTKILNQKVDDGGLEFGFNFKLNPLK